MSHLNVEAYRAYFGPQHLPHARSPSLLTRKAGDYEISQGPSGVSRLRLLPGFLPQAEADWVFSKLFAELPWSQKTNFKQGGFDTVAEHGSAICSTALCQPHPSDPMAKRRGSWGAAVVVSMLSDSAFPALATLQNWQTNALDQGWATLVLECQSRFRISFCPSEAYEEPRLTCWYGELPYTYSHSTMQANPQWHPVLSDLRETVEQVSGHSFNSLLCNLYRDGKDSIAWHSDSEPSLGRHPIIASLSLGDTRCFSMRKNPAPEENGDYTYVERLRIPLGHGTLLLMEGATQEDWQHQVAKEYHDRGPRINLTFRTIYPEPPAGRAPRHGPRS
ncbi:hypothetical protein JZ751_004176 [Albula glossodonta]|uniref:Alpha-ketoglutarate-dependent dioxygenase alkB homolog 3 n=1 Tax=Albula glossodonta TaxID=121402 RepID=A0A8T2NH28_9TELE|nr:hypothetical protein JZ751_004176 [Albula glossodonta]